MNVYMIINKKTKAVLSVHSTLFEARWAMEQKGLFLCDVTILELEAHEVVCP